MSRGIHIPMTPERRLVCDLTNLSRRVPLVPIERLIDVREVQQLRKRVRPKISWQVIMMRAYALAAVDFPELRRVYVRWPRAYYYQHPVSVCLLTISRQINGQEQLMFARFPQPENHTLLQLQEMFNDYRRLPIHELKQLQHQRRFSRMPWLVRKTGWHLMTDWMPSCRARQMGTFGMSLSGLRDTLGTFHAGPSTTILGYDQLCRGGQARVTLTFDHRVLDGKPAMDALDLFRKYLQRIVRNELKRLAHPPEMSPGDPSARAAGLIKRSMPGISETPRQAA